MIFLFMLLRLPAGMLPGLVISLEIAAMWKELCGQMHIHSFIHPCTQHSQICSFIQDTFQGFFKIQVWHQELPEQLTFGFDHHGREI